MLDRRWRKGVEQGLGPIGDRLRRMGVSADALTVFGLLASVATAVLIASEQKAAELAWHALTKEATTSSAAGT